LPTIPCRNVAICCRMATFPSIRANYSPIVSPYAIIVFLSRGGKINIATLIGVSLLGTVAGGLLDRVSARFCGSEPLVCLSPSSTTGQRYLRPLSLSRFCRVIHHLLQKQCSLGETSSLRQIVSGLVCGCLFTLIWLRFGLTLQSLILSFYTCLFMLIFVIDLKKQVIPNKIVYPSAGLVLLLACFLPGDKVGNLCSSLIGGAIAFVILLFVLVISHGKIGGGDIKLSILIGLATGFPELLIALAFAFFAIGIVAILLLFLRIKSFQDVIPFGPFLTTGAIVTLLWSQPIIDWFSTLATHS